MRSARRGERLESQRRPLETAEQYAFGEVSQVQGTVAAAPAEIRMLVETTAAGDPMGQESHNYMHGHSLFFGHLKPFVNDHRVNEETRRSFKLFRGNMLMLEIITFDEL
jgi:hypothetical protein